MKKTGKNRNKNSKLSNAIFSFRFLSLFLYSVFTPTILYMKKTVVGNDFQNFRIL